MGIFNWFKKDKKTKQDIETDVYNNRKSSEYSRTKASIDCATEYWNKAGYTGIAVFELPKTFLCNSEFAIDMQNGMQAWIIEAKYYDAYLNELFTEHKAELRDQKLNQILNDN